MLFVLNPGHGPKNSGTMDPGALGPSSLQEATQNLEVAKLLKEELETAGQKCLIIQDGDLWDVVHYTDQKNPDYFVSIHCNASTSAKAVGTECYALGSGGYGEKMAGAISKELASALKIPNRGAKFAGFIVLKCEAPAVLVETAFITNPITNKKMQDPSYDRITAQAIARGLSKACNFSYNPETTPEPKISRAKKAQLMGLLREIVNDL